MKTCKILFAQILLVLSVWSIVAAEEYQSCQECRKCHSDIFRLWSGSLHARSYTDPSFQAAYVDVLLERGKQAGLLCLTCHAPLTRISRETDFKSPSAQEGVSCWYCHSISSVNKELDLENYYNLDSSGNVYGPFEATGTTAHPIRYSSLHKTADLCVGCHEYTNENGTPILSTYSEWKESPYPREEIYCQNCHMPIMGDLTVADGRSSTGYYVTAHEFQGGHSKINLTHAVNMETNARRDDRQLHVTVEITNAESGHSLPTGVPIRKLILIVSLQTRDHIEISSARKIYRKVLTDKYGVIIENAQDMFLDATNIYSDNRIYPHETRVESFVFDLPDQLNDYSIETTLNYEYTRPLLQEESVRIKMAKNSILARDIE